MPQGLELNRKEPVSEPEPWPSHRTLTFIQPESEPRLKMFNNQSD